MDAVYAIITTILGIATCYLAYLQLKAQKAIGIASEYIKIHDKITVLGSRERTTATLSEINDRAQKGDVIFGHCRFCTGYPKEFFISATEAISRGVKFQAMVSERPETKEFIDFLLGGDPAYIEVRIPKEDVFASVYGIKGKEVMLMHHLLDKSIGVHYKDSLTAKYIETTFDIIWNEARKISRCQKRE